MNRMNEELMYKPVLAPASVAASTATSSTFVDCSGAQEVAFVIETGALGAGKKLSVELRAADAADGTDSVKLGEGEFADAAGTGPAVAVVSYRPAAANGRYVGVTIRHDAAEAVICGVIAQVRGGRLPAENAFVLTL